MKADLTSPKHSGMHILMDKQFAGGDLRELLQAGKALRYGMRGRDRAVIRLFVDDPPSSELRDEALTIHTGVLQVPTGGLMFAGANWQDGVYPQAGQTTVPPGSYAVEAWETSPDELDRLVGADLADRFGGQVELAQRLGVIVGLLFFFALFGSPFVGGLFASWMHGGFAMALLGGLGSVLTGYGLVALAGIVIRPVELARADLLLRYQRQWPPVVVSLTSDAGAQGPGIADLGA